MARLAIDQRLLQHHLQNRTGEVRLEVLVVDRDHALAGLQPDARDGVLALAGGVGAAELVELLHAHRSGFAAAGVAPLTPARSARVLVSVAMDLDPHVLAVELGDVERHRVLRHVRMLGALVDAQVAHQLALERTAREHALDGLVDDALGVLAVHDLAGRALLDATGIAGVVVVDLVFVLGAGEDDLVGVDDDDVVTAIDVRRVDGLVLALEAGGDESSEAADDETFARRSGSTSSPPWPALRRTLT